MMHTGLSWSIKLAKKDQEVKDHCVNINRLVLWLSSDYPSLICLCFQKGREEIWKAEWYFFYNRQQRAAIVEFSIQEIPHKKKIQNKKPEISYNEASGTFKSNISVFYVCICNLLLNTLDKVKNNLL